MATAPRTAVDRAGPDDVLQLAVDRGRVPMAIGALLVLDDRDRPPPQRVRSLLLRRAATSPARPAAARDAAGCGSPVWVEAGTEEVARLVDELPVALETLGDADGVARALLDATADLVTARLPLDRPLWRARLLLDPTGRVAGVALVAHHVLADGMGGLAVLGALADGIRGRRRSPGSARRPSRPAPGRSTRLRRAGEGRLGVTTSRPAWLAARRPADGPCVGSAAACASSGLRRPRLADRCSLLGRTGAQRRLEVATADLAVVRVAAPARTARASTTSSSRP